MLERLGRWFNQQAATTLYAAGFFFHVLKETGLFLRRRQAGLKVLVMQILFTGVESFLIISLISLAIGAVIIVQGMSILPRFGQGSLIYTILVVVILRELGPIMTAFIVNARSGTAIATELGNMVVSHEVEAYISVGVNPIAYLVVPRFLGVTISVVILTIYFNVFGLFGSYLVSQLIRPIQLNQYVNGLVQAIGSVDIISSLLKSLVFGVIISVVATYQGFAVEHSSREVPRRVISAVGSGFTLCFLANAVITLIYYL